MILTGTCRCHATPLRSKRIMVAVVLFALATNAFLTCAPHRIRRLTYGRQSRCVSPGKQASSDPRLANVLGPIGLVVHSLRRASEAPRTLTAVCDSQQIAGDAAFLSRFEVDSKGNISGGTDREAELARTFCRDGFVVARCLCPRAIDSIRVLGREATNLLDESRTVEEKLSIFGPIRGYDEDTIVGYAGGGEFGTDQFLETRGLGQDKVIPELGPRSAPFIITGRSALAGISRGVLRAMFRHSLPSDMASAFLDLVDSGEGGDMGRARDRGRIGEAILSSSSLRMCLYGGTSGTSFEAHTDTTLVTAIPCTLRPGLEILHPSTGRWVRPEAARDVQPGTDVVILAGKLLEVLGEGRYRAAVHRVICRPGQSEPRVSTPFLLRGPAGAAIQCSLLPHSIAERVTGQRRMGIGKKGTRVEQDPEVRIAELRSLLQSPLQPSEDTPFILAQLRKEDKVRETFAAFAPGGLDIMSVDPLLVRLNGFASRIECEALIDEALPSMTESTTWTDGTSQHDSTPVRISSTTWIADNSLPLLEEWTASVCSLSGLPASFMEKWQVARYEPGGYFSLHTDHVEAFNDLQCGGRLATLILYLNDNFEGGNTEFPSLDVSVKPRAGDAIYFHSVRTPLERGDAENMTVDLRSAHAGSPVRAGSKWIATKWIHPLPYPYGKEGPRGFEEAGLG